MKVSAVSNPIVSKPNRSVSFGRKLKEQEKPEYTHAIKDALDYLGVQNLSMIVHGSSFPSENRDTQIGSPYSKGADKFVDFLKLNGFNAVQLGPGGTIGKKDNSPYISKVFAKNELFIDLEPLKSDKYANILSEKTYKHVSHKTKETVDKNYNYTNFDKAFANYETALGEAYATFKSKVANKDSKALALNKEFDRFKKDNENWVETDGLYKVLSKEHGNEKFEKWGNALDRELPQKLKAGDKQAKARYDELKQKYNDEIEQNSFEQFIADKQMQENNKHRKEIGFNYIGDLLVGFNDSDVWANQNAFLKDWKLGCPFGGAENGPQTWGIPVLDPKKLFNKDGSLGESGKVLKDKMSYSLKNFDNVRIDHALGLVDPYIYKEDTVVKNENGAIRRDKLWANNVSQMHDIDPDGNFRKVLSKIVLPTFKEFGADKNQAVWEDLCSTTQAFNDIYYNQEHLPGITQTEWRRAENSPAENWSLVGSHDSKPASVMIKQDGTRYSDAWNVDYLSGYLNPDPAKGKERAEYKDKIVNNPVEHVKAKFTELFRGSKNLQMMFVDFFGIDKVYNYGGQDKPTNWKLRVDNDYEDDYYRALQDKNSYALNMPEILGQAVRAKMQMEVAKTSDPYKQNQLRNNLETKLNPLLTKLDDFKDILKEKEEVKAIAPQQEPVVETNNQKEQRTTVSAKTETAKSTETVKSTEAVKPTVVTSPVESEKTAKPVKTSKSSGMSNTENILFVAAGIALVTGALKKVADKIKAKFHKQPQQEVTQEVNKK